MRAPSPAYRLLRPDELPRGVTVRRTAVPARGLLNYRITAVHVPDVIDWAETAPEALRRAWARFTRPVFSRPLVARRRA